MFLVIFIFILRECKKEIVWNLSWFLYLEYKCEA